VTRLVNEGGSKAGTVLMFHGNVAHPSPPLQYTESGTRLLPDSAGARQSAAAAASLRAIAAFFAFNARGTG
jgi:hypothetical protein